MDLEYRGPDKETCLSTEIDKLDGVDNTEYNGHFGPNIWVRVETESDNKETWDAIYALIDRFSPFQKVRGQGSPHSELPGGDEELLRPQSTELKGSDMNKPEKTTCLPGLGVKPQRTPQDLTDHMLDLAAELSGPAAGSNGEFERFRAADALREGALLIRELARESDGLPDPPVLEPQQDEGSFGHMAESTLIANLDDPIIERTLIGDGEMRVPAQFARSTRNVLVEYSDVTDTMDNARVLARSRWLARALAEFGDRAHPKRGRDRKGNSIIRLSVGSSVGKIGFSRIIRRLGSIGAWPSFEPWRKEAL